MNTKQIIEFCLEELDRCLDDDHIDVSLAIYLHDDDHLSSFPFSGVPSIAADGSDRVIWVWDNGDYDPLSDYRSALEAAFSLKTAEEVAGILGVKKHELSRLAKKKKIKYNQFGRSPHCWRFSEADIDELKGINNPLAKYTDDEILAEMTRRQLLQQRSE